jgi:hypothetical protein
MSTHDHIDAEAYFSRRVGRVSLKEEDFMLYELLLYFMFVIVIFILFGNFVLRNSVFGFRFMVFNATSTIFKLSLCSPDK